MSKDSVLLDRERKDGAADELQTFMISIHAEEKTEVSRPNKGIFIVLFGCTRSFVGSES
jgi:hypothetical protein